MSKPNFKLIATHLMLAIECWARDEDGIHPEAWEAYKQGREALGAKAIWSDDDAELRFEKSLHAELKEGGCK